MFEIGRVCVKLLGRDAGMKCVVIDKIDANMVMIDGETRRRKCNVKHLEPLDDVLEISKSAPRAEVIRAFKGLGIELAEKAETKAKKNSTRPKRFRVIKAKPVVEEKPKAKKEAKKAKPAPEKQAASEEKAE